MSTILLKKGQKNMPKALVCKAYTIENERESC